MGFVCVLPDTMSAVDANYMAAQANYARKKQEILHQLDIQTNESGQSFIEQLKINFAQNMSQKIQSPDSLREVSFDTILKHLYKAAEAGARGIIEQNDSILNSLQGTIQSIQNTTQNNIENEKKQINAEIDSVISQFAEQMQIGEIVNKYLPQLLSGDNQKLASAQILGYCKSIFKQEIQKRMMLTDISDIIQKHPAIILGYIREDALAKAATDAIEQFKMMDAKAQVVGAEKTKIDILISLTGGASSALSADSALVNLLQQLDAVNSFSVVGTSNYENSEFLGVQAKPWRLYLPTTDWNRNTIGSRAGLLAGFQATYPGLEGASSWHLGVLYLSQNLTEVLGANTVMYATGKSIIWTDELLNDMIHVYNKYFAFSMSPEHKTTSHVVLADHYG